MRAHDGRYKVWWPWAEGLPWSERFPPGTEVKELGWPECGDSYADSPSTKLELHLRLDWHHQPTPEDWRYEVIVPREIWERSRELLERFGRPADVLLIANQAHTQADQKRMPPAAVRSVADWAKRAGYVPIVLHWSQARPAWAEGLPWLGSAELPYPADPLIVAGLFLLAGGAVTVDSGPQKLAAAVGCPQVCYWSVTHPVHYIYPEAPAVHLVPRGHRRRIRGPRAPAYFREHYRYLIYDRPEEYLPGALSLLLDGELRRRGGFWVRRTYEESDRGAILEIYVGDDYRLRELKDEIGPVRYVIDLGAHIGTFARLVHELWPLARIVCCDVLRSNCELVRRNAPWADVVNAAATYLPPENIGLLTRMFPGSWNPQATMVAERAERAWQRAKRNINAVHGGEFLAVERKLETVTVEQLAARMGAEEIDLLKLDCEGCEHSVLVESPMVREGKVRTIVGEYHDRDRFVTQTLPGLESHYDLVRCDERQKAGFFTLRRRH